MKFFVALLGLVLLQCGALSADTVTTSSSSSSNDGGGTVYRHSETYGNGPTQETTIIGGPDGTPLYQYQQFYDNSGYLGDFDNNDDDFGIYY